MPKIVLVVLMALLLTVGVAVAAKAGVHPFMHYYE